MAEDFTDQMETINQQIQNLHDMQTEETGRKLHNNHIIQIIDKEKNAFKTARGEKYAYVKRKENEGNRRFFHCIQYKVRRQRRNMFEKYYKVLKFKKIKVKLEFCTQ